MNLKSARQITKTKWQVSIISQQITAPVLVISRGARKIMNRFLLIYQVAREIA